MIKDGLKQPNWIKISFTVDRKEMTRSIVPNQAHFGPKFLLTQMLPSFESKIASHLPANKQCDAPTLVPLLEQCFQEVGVTEWKNVISANCPDEDAKTIKNLIECQ